MRKIVNISLVCVIVLALVGFLRHDYVFTQYGFINSISLIFFLCALFFLAKKFVLRVGHKEEEEPEFTGNGFMGGATYNLSNEPDSESVYKDYILQMLSIIMNANGRQMVCELDRVKSTISRYYKTQAEQNEALKKFKTYLDSDLKLKDVCNKIKSVFDDSAHCEAILLEMLAVAYADGTFDKNEENVIRSASKNFDILKGQFELLITLFRQKKFSGFYGDSTVDYDPWLQKDREQKAREEQKKKAESGQGYWYRDRNGRKHWQDTSYKNTSSSSSGSSSSGSGSSSHSYSSSASSYALEEAYRTLGIPSSATNAEVTSAWKKNMRKWHPDLFEAQGAEAVRNATENSKIINQAYEIISRHRGM